MRYSEMTVRWPVALNPIYGTYYSPFMGLYNTSYFYNTPIVVKCVIKRLYWKVDVAPAAGTSWNMTLWVNGAATALSVDMTSAANYVEETDNEITLNEGDYAFWVFTPTGATGAVGKPLYTLDIETEDNSGMLISGSESDNITSTQYFGVGDLRYSDTESVVQSLIPTNGKITKVIGRLAVAPGAGKSRKFTLRKNGANTGLVLTIADANVTATASAEIDIAAGDLLSVLAERVSSPAASRIILMYKWEPEIAGEMIYMHSTSQVLDTSSTNRFKAIRGSSTLDPSEYINAAMSYEATYRKFYTLLSTAPGAGKAYNFMFRDDYADTDLDLSVADTNVSNSNTTDEVLVEDKSIIIYKVNGVNTPTASRPKFGIVGYTKGGGTPLRRLMGVGL